MKKLIFLLLLSANCYAASWECVISGMACYTKRMKVPSGWIVKEIGIHNDSLTFVPDEKHEWKL